MLDNDIIRDTLLCIEKACESHTDENDRFVAKAKLNWKVIYEDEFLCRKYLMEEIQYCILKLMDAKMIDTEIPGRTDNISILYIHGITWYGHTFLSNIRDNGIWNKVKNKGGRIAIESLTAFADVAKDVTASVLKSYLGIQ